MRLTDNAKLTIYEANDITSYLTSTGWNGTMEKIDAYLGNLNTQMEKNTADITALESQVSGDHDEINNITTELSDLTSTVSGNTANIAGLTTRINTAETNITSLQDDVAKAGTVYRGVLSANETTLAITIGEFTDNSLVDIYASVYGLAPITVELRPASGGQPNLCVTTWDAQTSDVAVAVIIKNN